MSLLTSPVTPLIDVLVAAQTRLPGVQGLLLASVDGRPIAHVMPNVDPRAASALVAATLQLGQRLADLLGRSALDEATIRSADGYVTVYSVGNSAVLMLLLSRSANLARTHLVAREVKDEIELVIRGNS
jgi:uncharacterized protein